MNVVFNYINMLQLIYSCVDGYLGSTDFSLFWNNAATSILVHLSLYKSLSQLYSKQWKCWVVGHMHLHVNIVPICSSNRLYQFTLPTSNGLLFDRSGPQATSALGGAKSQKLRVRVPASPPHKGVLEQVMKTSRTQVLHLSKWE